MRPIALFWLVLGVATYASVAGERNLGLMPRLDPADKPVQRWAVVIGISDYQDPKITDLKYADADAKAFCEFLRSPQGGASRPNGSGSWSAKMPLWRT